MNQRPLKVGIVGVGNIATNPNVGYIPNLLKMPEKVEIVALADVQFERAEAGARKFGIPQAYGSLDEMLASADVEAVVNLTHIPAPAETSRKILESGRHCVSEKPIATTLEEADMLVELAQRRGLTYVCAPVVALLPHHREVRRLIEAGVIGKVAFARVRSSHGGPASWAFPTDPTWFYQRGAGPLFDMGVYGIHTITSMLGPARRVVAFSGITEPTRVVAGGPAKGKVIEVTADDNTLLMLDFGGSTFAFVDGTYNVNAAKSPRIEIFGRAGTISINDYPAIREGAPPFEVYRVDALAGAAGWITPNPTQLRQAQAHFDTYHNACLVEHLVDCVRSGERPLLSAEHARHALEIMLMALESARSGRAIELRTTF
ncbi:MAG: Gfo/Idh/MocA family oxidoreductase [Chloroflexota bacterium]